MSKIGSYRYMRYFIDSVNAIAVIVEFDRTIDGAQAAALE